MTDPTARRAAMAEAIRERMADLFRRSSWDAARVPDELAEAADVAAMECEGKDET
jgi:hypothetical protein